MARTVIETLHAHRDARGALFEPLDDAGLAAQKNVHVVLTEPGAVRGNHFHSRGREVTTILGPAEIRLEEDGAIRDLRVPAGEVWRLTIPPGVVHAYRNPGPGPMVLVSFSSELHDPTSPDTVRREIL